jgi:histidinol-phosphatase (PHP family)
VLPFSPPKTDFHIHTEFSYDSSIRSDELLPHAQSLGYEAIAITEHLDLLPQELGYFGLKSLHKYLEKMALLKNEYQDIRLLAGVEVGDYHRVIPFAKGLLDMYHFDLILGSVHFLSDHTNVAVSFGKPLLSDQVSDYYRQNLELVQKCEIDILAHLGVYKRYYSTQPKEDTQHGILKAIFETIIDRGIALEVNYSCFRKSYKRILPDREHLELYAGLGGKLISIGSDSHDLRHFDDYYATALNEIKDLDFELIQF